MIHNISCMIIDVINTTLATCDYTNCTNKCIEYLMFVADNCPVVFHNITYEQLWHTLYTICQTKV